MEWVPTRPEHAQRFGAILGSLEVKRREWRAIYSPEIWFAVLMKDAKKGHDDNEAPASETVILQEDHDSVHVWSKKKTVKGESKKIRNRWTGPKDMEINSCELDEVFAYKDEEDGNLWITVDFGASENVMSEKMAPQFDRKPSTRSRGGVK